MTISPPFFAVANDANAAKRYPRLAWACCGAATLVVVALFVMLLVFSERNVHVVVMSSLPSFEESVKLDSVTCTCKNYPYRRLFGIGPHIFLTYMVQNNFRPQMETYSNLYTQRLSGANSSFELAMFAAADEIISVDPLSYTTDVVIEGYLGLDELNALKKRMVDSFVINMHRLLPRGAKFTQVNLCDTFPCIAFNATLLPPAVSECGMFQGSISECLAVYNGTSVGDTCDAGNQLLSCEVILAMYQQYYYPVIAETLVENFVHPIEDGATAPPQSAVFAENEVYWDADHNKFFYDIPDLVGRPYNYEAFDPYTSQFQEEDCEWLSCTAFQSEATLPFLVRILAYTVTASVVVFVVAAHVFKCLAGCCGKGSGGGGGSGRVSRAPPADDEVAMGDKSIGDGDNASSSSS